MATFAVNETARREQFISTGQATYNFNFQVNAASELQVYVNDNLQTDSVAYNATISSDGTGSITFIDNSGGGGTNYTPSSGDYVTIIGDLPLSRTTTFNTAADITTANLDTEFDNTLFRQQQLKEMMDRSIQLKVTTPRTVTGSGTNGPLEWPYDATPSNNASKVIAYNSAGTGLELGPTTANLNTLAGIVSDISTVANIASDVTTVANMSSSDIAAVASISSNVTSVANISSDVTTVAGISSDISALENIKTDITAVSNIASDVTAVSNNTANINTLAGMTGLSTLASNADDITTVADNISDVNNFAETYRISATAPTTSLDIGDLWFDTTNSVMKVYSSSGWITAASAVNGTAERFKYTATASQTTFSGSDDNGNVLGYDAGFMDVYLNGIKLVAGTSNDYVATNGTSIVLNSGAASGDILEAIAYGTFELSNFSIDDANDVQTSGVQDGQVLLYNSSAGQFQPGNASSAEVYGFNKDSSGNLIVTTTNQGVDNITNAQYAAFDDVLFSASGFTFSINSDGNLIATI